MRLWQGTFASANLAGLVLALPAEAARALDLESGQVVTLRAGHRRSRCRVKLMQKPGPAALLSRHLVAALFLPARKRLWLRRDAGGELSLGPILGFLSLRSIFAERRAMPYAGDEAFFRAACRLASRTGGLAYVFGPGDIDWKSRTARGYTYRLRPSANGGGSSGRWVAATFPLPDVVYNRILGRGRELSRPIQEVERRLRESSDTAGFFNPGYFDKWRVSEILERDSTARQYIPVTRKASPRQLHDMLLSEGAVYVKPRAGFAGRGIIRVERLAANRYHIVQISGARPVGRRGSWQTVVRLVGSAARQQPAIVQQAVRPPSLRGRHFDLRAMVQKDESGRWRLTALVAKVASRGNITTHIRTGGAALAAGTVLRRVFGEGAAEVKRRVGVATLTVARALEQGLGMELGELGMDVAVDRTGRPWILEVNAKPGRKVFKIHPGWNRTWLERLIYYGGFRAGFRRDDCFAGCTTRTGQASQSIGPIMEELATGEDAAAEPADSALAVQAAAVDGSLTQAGGEES